ncbi:MAG TPA: 4Fe-4S binding protein [Desulfobacterales bacterium]|nr:4Fe-4S binding protein [Desulfobacterales bacterium]
MKIITARRTTQIFFAVLFLWFCIVATLGEKWWQLRGWPVNWLFELDPLVGLGTLLSTRTLYKGLLWGLVTIVLTVLLGRFFCGWVCPFGSIHQFVGFLGKRKKSSAEKVGMNRYHRLQVVKYWILIFLLAVSSTDLFLYFIRMLFPEIRTFFVLIGIIFSAFVLLASFRLMNRPGKGFEIGLSVALIAVALTILFKDSALFSASLQIGLLDPISLVYRSVNLIILPLADAAGGKLSVSPRFYQGTALIGVIFLTAVFLNLKIPRFYCRFICPLGALLGIFGRYAIWRIGKKETTCIDCHQCELDCDGACSPSSTIKISECIICLNCFSPCQHNNLGYRTAPSAAGETLLPDLSRRAVVLSFFFGAAAVPMIRINGGLAGHWESGLIRPPGALAEKDFLSRCIKCGQCMRICPTNVIHPAGFEGGLEGLWTPLLNFRIGTSGCQLNCVACGNLCPTAAIRPITIDERLGEKSYVDKGPIRIGTAFVDRGRCLPWAMDRPCIVCQENCPVSPKAIFTRETFNTVNINTALIVKTAGNAHVEFNGEVLTPYRFSTGDYFCVAKESPDDRPRPIIENTTRTLSIDPEFQWKSPPVPKARVEIHVRLQQPFVDLKYCIGCGVCEHECPVLGKRAIRVTAENETRDPKHALLLEG